jgi:hypothetical protein
LHVSVAAKLLKVMARDGAAPATPAFFRLDLEAHA